MARYLLVDDRDGSVIAELASPQQAMRLLGRLARDGRDGPPVSVVRIESHEGGLVATSSIVSVRPLELHIGPPTTKPSTDGRAAHRSSPRPRLSRHGPSTRGE